MIQTPLIEIRKRTYVPHAKKKSTMKLELFKSFIANVFQMISIPILYFFAYNFFRLFHQPNDSIPSNLYGLTLILLIYIILFSIPILTILETGIKKRNFQVIVNILWFCFIIFFTVDELKHQPFGFGLILFCIFISIFIKFTLKTRMKLLKSHTNK